MEKIKLPDDFTQNPPLLCKACGYEGIDYTIEVKANNQCCYCAQCKNFIKNLPKKENYANPFQLEQIERKTNGCCKYCMKYLSAYNGERTVEHVIPRKWNGKHELENLWLACKSCNSSKGAKTLPEFREYKDKKASGKLTLFI